MRHDTNKFEQRKRYPVGKIATLISSLFCTAASNCDGKKNLQFLEF